MAYHGKPRASRGAIAAAALLAGAATAGSAGAQVVDLPDCQAAVPPPELDLRTLRSQRQVEATMRRIAEDADCPKAVAAWLGEMGYRVHATRRTMPEGTAIHAAWSRDGNGSTTPFGGLHAVWANMVANSSSLTIELDERSKVLSVYSGLNPL